MINDLIPDILTHSGTKGMKWGVRHDPGHEGQQAKTEKIAKLDTKFEKRVALANKGVITPEFHNAIVGRMNSRVQALNDNPKYHNIDMAGPNSKLKKDYDRDAEKALVSSFEDATREHFGSNASGTKKGVYDAKTDQIHIVDKGTVVVHVDVVVPDVTIQLKRDATGHIASVEVVPFKPAMAQTDNFITSFLTHHGVKGMKWGQRKRSGGSDTHSKSMNELHKAKSSEDATKATETQAKIKAGGTKSVSNAELQHLVNRMNLEQQFSNLSGKKETTKGEKFAKALLSDSKDVGRSSVKKLAGKVVVFQIGKALVKKGILG